MSYHSDLRSVDGLASTLPFDLDDSERVNNLYEELRIDDRASRDPVVALWTYCYIRRYFLVKFIRETGFQTSELEKVIEQAYRKVEKFRENLENADRYAQWVSVICKNTYLNFVARRKYVLELDSTMKTTLEHTGEAAILPPDTGTVEDAGALYLSLVRAIGRLPTFLQSIARMRFVEDLSYEEISRLTGNSVPTVRAYVHKARSRFRKDPGLLAFESSYRGSYRGKSGC